MISSELAKKLKNAGFMTGYVDSPDRFMHLPDNSVLFIPTLSELIEECGDRFGKLVRTKMPSGMINWVALEAHPQTIPIVHGVSFPEEAVANLWLELNKK